MKQCGCDAGQVMAVSLAVVGQFADISASEASIVDSLVNKVFQVNQLVYLLGAQFLLREQDLVAHFEVHFGYYGLNGIAYLKNFEFDEAGVVVTCH